MASEEQADIAKITLALAQVHLKEAEARTIAETLVGQGYNDLDRLQCKFSLGPSHVIRSLPRLTTNICVQLKSFNRRPSCSDGHHETILHCCYFEYQDSCG